MPLLINYYQLKAEDTPMHIDNFRRAVSCSVSSAQTRSWATNERGMARVKVIATVRQHGASNNKTLQLDKSALRALRRCARFNAPDRAPRSHSYLLV